MAKTTRSGPQGRVVDRDLGAANFAAAMAVLSGLPKDAGAYVGWTEASGTYDDGTPIVVVAATQEFGSPAQNIPSRPALGTTVDKNQTWYLDLLEDAVTDSTAPTVRNARARLRSELEDIGEEVEGDVRDSIFDWTDPGNAPSTIEEKRRDDPLVDSGEMAEAVLSEVRGV